jgi:hypothetical protein
MICLKKFGAEQQYALADYICRRYSQWLQPISTILNDKETVAKFWNIANKAKFFVNKPWRRQRKHQEYRAPYLILFLRLGDEIVSNVHHQRQSSLRMKKNMQWKSDTIK